jgi:hypothetical protein
LALRVRFGDELPRLWDVMGYVVGLHPGAALMHLS